MMYLIMYKSVQLVNQLVFIIKYVPHLPGFMDPKRPRHSPYFSLKLESTSLRLETICRR